MNELLKELVSYPTTAENPQAIHEAMNYIADFSEERGMHVERFESNGHESLVATVEEGVKTPKVMLGAHLDVVPAPDELFSLHQENGKLYGRGTLDMKFAIATYMQLVDELQGSLPNYDFGIMVTSDEEIGGFNGTLKLLEEGYIPEVCILPDGGDNWQVQLHSKGVLHLNLQSRGVSAHGSRPWLGENAITPLMETVQEVQTLFPEQGPESNTCNLGKILGGTAVTQVADHAEAAVDIRTVSNDESDRLFSEIQAICKKRGIDVSVTIQGSATEFSLDNPYIKTFAEIVTEVTGTDVTGSRTPGSSDARFFADYNVPCISLYPPGGGHHGPGEHIDEKAFYQFKDTLRLFLDRVARVSD